MSKISRRALIATGLATAAGASGWAAARRYGLMPPDSGGVYGLGETLDYAAQRILARHSVAREFDRSQISKEPFVNGPPLKSEEFLRFQAGGFTDWKLTVDGLVTRPAAFSVAELKSYPSRSQITHLACEEGWSISRSGRACRWRMCWRSPESCRRRNMWCTTRLIKTGGIAWILPRRCIRRRWLLMD